MRNRSVGRDDERGDWNDDITRGVPCKGKTDEARREGRASTGQAVPYETYKKTQDARTGR